MATLKELKARAAANVERSQQEREARATERERDRKYEEAATNAYSFHFLEDKPTKADFDRWASKFPPLIESALALGYGPRMLECISLFASADLDRHRYVAEIMTAATAKPPKLKRISHVLQDGHKNRFSISVAVEDFCEFIKYPAQPEPPEPKPIVRQNTILARPADDKPKREHTGKWATLKTLHDEMKLINAPDSEIVEDWKKKNPAQWSTYKADYDSNLQATNALIRVLENYRRSCRKSSH